MADDVAHLKRGELDAALDDIRCSPRDVGTVDLIVCRPRAGERRGLDEAMLDLADGLVGDSWKYRRSTRSADGRAHPDMQLNVMNSRVVALVAQDRHRWPLAGDQLFVDFDLSQRNVPAGTKLSLGEAVIEITAEPHTGCHKFVSRFGVDAMQFVNSPIGRQLNLRGINARVVKGGRIRAGDRIRKIAFTAAAEEGGK